jgi:hypothetical protein
VSGLRPETAQARGRALLNLKCASAEGGLLGRTLLTLVSNKVRAYAGQKGSVPRRGGPSSLWTGSRATEVCLSGRGPPALSTGGSKPWRVGVVAGVHWGKLL